MGPFLFAPSGPFDYLVPLPWALCILCPSCGPFAFCAPPVGPLFLYELHSLFAHSCNTAVTSFCISESSFDMLPRHRSAQSYQSAPPRFFLLALDAPEAPQPPQNIFIEAATDNKLDNTLEYAIEAAEFPEVASNAVVLVDAAVPPLPLRPTQSGQFGLKEFSRRSLALGTSSPSSRRPRGCRRCRLLRSTPIWRRGCATILRRLFLSLARGPEAPPSTSLSSDPSY